MVKAYMTIKMGTKFMGKLEMDLLDDSVPKTVQNFVELLRRRQTGRGYLNSTFHRLIRGFMIQGGDFTKGDGTGGESIYGTTFPDENFIHSHNRAGTLSMANAGHDTNGSQFFISFRPTPHLDGKHVVFGYVDLETSGSLLQELERVQTGDDDRPVVPLTIAECGVIEEDSYGSSQKETTVEDDNEIDLDEDGGDEELKTNAPTEPEPKDDEPEEEEEEDSKPLSKAEALRRRMRKLKMKMNQARQLNKQEVLKEGERLGSMEGASKAKRRQMMQDKQIKETQWASRNAKALEVAASHGIEGKHLIEQAGESMKKAYKKEEKSQANRFEMHDRYNSEGQHRSYSRDLKSVRHAAARSDIDLLETSNPLMNSVVDEDQEREGARQIASEMKRRSEKQAKKKRERVDFEETDVSYINNRNKRFNQKIGRNFDKHTAEIRQNLERGTAL